MKRNNHDESIFVITEVTGEERRHTLEMMVQVFTALIEHDDHGSGFPIWGESMAKLMEVAYVLAKLRIFIHFPGGTPATMKEIAEWLCKALHCEVPANIYEAPSRTKKRGRRTIVDYYAMLWRENESTPASSLLWAKPIQFPRLKSYRHVFD